MKKTVRLKKLGLRTATVHRLDTTALRDVQGGRRRLGDTNCPSCSCQGPCDDDGDPSNP